MHRPNAGQGGNSINVRLYNERAVLTALRRLGRASKADLARHLNLTDNAAGVIVRDLHARRLVRVLGKRTGGRGQPATLLALDADGAYALGAKIGRRSIDVLLVDFCGRVLARRRHEAAFPRPERAVSLVAGAVAELAAALPASGAARLAGLGVAAPDNPGGWRRELGLEDDGLAAWAGFDLGAALRRATDLPVVVENDGTAAAVAELFAGHGRASDDFLYVFVGTAVGGGVVLGGDYRRGASGNAGDVGLMPVAASRLPSAPRPNGPFDILLTRASLSSLTRHLRAAGAALDDRAALEALLEAGGPAIDAWLDDCADALTGAVLAGARVLDVPLVVLDGDLPGAVLAALIERLRASLDAASPEARRPPELRAGTVGREAAALGAALLPLHRTFSPNPDVLRGVEPRPPAARAAFDEAGMSQGRLES